MRENFDISLTLLSSQIGSTLLFLVFEVARFIVARLWVEAFVISPDFQEPPDGKSRHLHPIFYCVLFTIIVPKDFCQKPDLNRDTVGPHLLEMYNCDEQLNRYENLFNDV